MELIGVQKKSAESIEQLALIDKRSLPLYDVDALFADWLTANR